MLLNAACPVGRQYILKHSLPLEYPSEAPSPGLDEAGLKERDSIVRVLHGC